MSNEIQILEPIVKENIINYFYLYNNKKYTFSNKFLTKNIDIYKGIEGVISIFVPHCILTGKTIYSDIPADKRFLENLQKLVPIFKKWYKNDKLYLNIKIPSKDIRLDSEKKVISTFTLGVDSFFTLYSNIEKIDIILFIIGFDIKKNKKKLLEQTIKNLEEISKIYNKELILCETDLKNNVNHGKGFSWGSHFHGPAIFNIAYGLANKIKTFIIPSSHPLKNDFIWGSGFSIDKNYSSSLLNIEHFGDLSRPDKIKFIINFDDRCLNYLRVCWINKNGEYNCTRCEKCLRTFYTIELLGYKDKAITFNTNIDGKIFWNFKPEKETEFVMFNEVKELEKNIKSHN